LRYILTIFIIITFSGTCIAKSDDTITKLENSLFGIDYSNQTDTQRLARLEQNVYGKSFNDSIIKRIERLYTDMAGEQIGQEITPKSDSFEEEELSSMQEKVNYPVLDEIEKSALKRTYGDKDLNSRLVFLEKYVFSNTFENESYSERVDRLRKKILGTRMNELKYENNDYEDYNNSYDTLANSFDSSYYNQNDYNSSTSEINRLRQEEQEFFNRNYDNEDIDKRLDRLYSVKKAKSYSSKYDNNKFQQKFSTAMQIGTMLLMILAMVL